GLTQFDQPIVEIPSFIDDALPLSELARNYLNTLLQGDRKNASKLILEAVEKGTDIRDIYLQVLENVQLEIGRLWQTNQLDVAEEHFSTAVTGLVMAQLYPYIKKSGQPERTLVAACVAGELHDLGVRMVSDFFELSGWKTYFVGANTPATSILQAVTSQEADLLALSATIPLHVVEAENVITALRKTNNCKDVKIIVGGRAFMIDQELWKKIGADGFALDAKSALDVAASLFKK
ncbi:MAG: B12-binding domain-containing protein, partial [Candidatus Odinarchaeota archaeon]